MVLQFFGELLPFDLERLNDESRVDSLATEVDIHWSKVLHSFRKGYKLLGAHF